MNKVIDWYNIFHFRLNFESDYLKKFYYFDHLLVLVSRHIKVNYLIDYPIKR